MLKLGQTLSIRGYLARFICVYAAWVHGPPAAACTGQQPSANREDKRFVLLGRQAPRFGALVLPPDPLSAHLVKASKDPRESLAYQAWAMQEGSRALSVSAFQQAELAFRGMELTWAHQVPWGVSWSGPLPC
jgi:hypothetical protein